MELSPCALIPAKRLLLLLATLMPALFGGGLAQAQAPTYDLDEFTLQVSDISQSSAVVTLGFPQEVIENHLPNWDWFTYTVTQAGKKPGNPCHIAPGKSYDRRQTLRHLHNDTEYTVDAYWYRRSQDGGIPWPILKTLSVTFRTSPLPPGVQATATPDRATILTSPVQIDRITHNSARVTWDGPTDKGGTYYVHYSAKTHYNRLRYSQKNSYTIRDLSSDVDHEVFVAYWLGDQRAKRSANVTFRTLPKPTPAATSTLIPPPTNTPFPPPTNTPSPTSTNEVSSSDYELRNLQLSEITHNSVKVSWEDPYPLDNVYRIWLEWESDREIKTVYVKRPETQQVVVDLLPDEPYEIWVQKFYIGFRRHELYATFRTLPEPQMQQEKEQNPPSPTPTATATPTPMPTHTHTPLPRQRQAQQTEEEKLPDDGSLGLVVSERTQSRITVEWSEPPNLLLYYLKVKGPGVSIDGSPTEDTRSWTIDKLPPDAEYQFELNAYLTKPNSSGKNWESVSLSVRTLPAGGQSNPPPSNTPLPPPPSNTPIPPPPSNTPIPPPPTSTPIPPPPSNTPVPQVDADLLAEIEAKIARHRDETGRADLVAGFTAARAGLTGKMSPEDALAALDSGWKNDLWRRIRAALNGLRG